MFLIEFAHIIVMLSRLLSMNQALHLFEVFKGLLCFGLGSQRRLLDLELKSEVPPKAELRAAHLVVRQSRRLPSCSTWVS